MSPFFISGGEGGIRTLDTRLTYTPLAGERLQPLGHFSKLYLNNAKKSVISATLGPCRAVRENSTT